MRVVVIHGLWMWRWDLWLLARRLRRCGLDVHTFGYPSVRRSPADNAASLAAFLKGLGEEPVNFVVHSLGGLVLLACLRQHPSIRVGRVVMMGTPMKGARLARRLVSCRLSRWMLGRSTGIGGLLHGTEPLSGLEVGVISGTRALGASMFFGGLRAPHDGAVEQHETVYEGATDSLSLHISHVGMIFSRKIIAPVCQFLGNGKFG